MNFFLSVAHKRRASKRAQNFFLLALLQMLFILKIRHLITTITNDYSIVLNIFDTQVVIAVPFSLLASWTILISSPLVNACGTIILPTTFALSYFISKTITYLTHELILQCLIQKFDVLHGFGQVRRTQGKKFEVSLFVHKDLSFNV